MARCAGHDDRQAPCVGSLRGPYTATDVGPGQAGQAPIQQRQVDPARFEADESGEARPHADDSIPFLLEELVEEVAERLIVVGHENDRTRVGHSLLPTQMRVLRMLWPRAR